MASPASPSALARLRQMVACMHPSVWLLGWTLKRPTTEKFDRLYRLSDGDPWHTENAPYERQKRADLLSVLAPRYNMIVDVGCGTGTITRLLAAHGPILGLDASAEALKYARQKAIPGVEYRQGDLRTVELPERYDCVVASEVLYYLSETDRREVVGRLAEGLAPGGHFVVVGAKADERVVPVLAARPDLRLSREVVREADVWRPYQVALFEKVG
jgi:trans-aconitate methyltransferase